MKNKLKVPVLFIIVGLPGSGKTQLSRYLARRLRIHKIHSENIKANLNKSKGVASSHSSKLIHKVSLLLIEEFARLKMSVVCDTNTQSDRNRQDIYALARKHKLQPIIIYQQVDRQTAWLRHQARQKNKGADLKSRRQQFEALALQMEPPIKERVITVSGVHGLDVQAQIIFCKLLEMQLLTNDQTSLKKIAKPGLINLIASCYKNPMPKKLPIALNSSFKLREEN